MYYDFNFTGLHYATSSFPGASLKLVVYYVVVVIVDIVCVVALCVFRYANKARRRR